MTTTKITKHSVTDTDYDAQTYKLFGAKFSMNFEPQVFHAARELSTEYEGGTWDFFALSNGGFFMSLRSDKCFNVSGPSEARVNMSAEGLGIAACLCAFSRLSFGRDADAETFGRQYYLLRAFMFEHLEAPVILRATD
jgi:hypothetical protein